MKGEQRFGALNEPFTDGQALGLADDRPSQLAALLDRPDIVKAESIETANFVLARPAQPETKVYSDRPEDIAARADAMHSFLEGTS